MHDARLALLLRITYIFAPRVLSAVGASGAVHLGLVTQVLDHFAGAKARVSAHPELEFQFTVGGQVMRASYM